MGLHVVNMQGYICSNSPLIDKEGKRAIDLLNPWLEGWRKDNANKVGHSSRALAFRAHAR